MKKEKLLEVKNLSKFFISSNGVKKAIDDISFNINKGEVLGLIGQSGSGKTTTGNAIVRLLKEINGIIAFDDEVVSGKLNKSQKKDFAKNIQMVFQNPHTALNPKRNVFSTLQEPLVVNGIIKENTKEFLKDWKKVSKYWEYTFAQKFYDIQNESIKDLINITKKINKKLNEDNPSDNLKTRIADYFITIKDFENQYKKKLDNTNISLKKVYDSHKKKLDKKDLSKNEKNLIEKNENFEELKNVQDIALNLKSKIIEIQNEEMHELKSCTKKTYKLMKSLLKDRKKRKIFLKRSKFLASNPQDIQFVNKDIAHVKKEYLFFKKISNKKLCSYFEIINDFDEMVFDNKELDNYFLKEIVEKMLLSNKEEFEKISIKYKAKLDKAIKEWKNILLKYKFDFKLENLSSIKKYNKAKELFKIKQIYNFKRGFNKLFWKQDELKKEFLASKKDLELNLNDDFKKIKTDYQETIEKNNNSEKLPLFKDVRNIEVKKRDEEKNNYQLWKKQEIKKLVTDLSTSKVDLRKNIINFNLLKKQYKKSSLLILKDIKNKINNSIDKNDIRKELKSSIFTEQKRVKLIRLEQKILNKILSNQKLILGIKKSFGLQRYIAIKKSIIKEKVYSILNEVGLKSEHAYRYPHEFSGGQLQRIVIARAIIINPKLIIADEPVASLDVSIQAQVLNILNELVRKRNISMLFIAHDISVIEYISDTIIIMHNGKIVEKGVSKKIIKNPVHPYSKTLFESVPSLKNVKEPFKKIDVDHSYIFEYRKESPFMQKYATDHYVLANNKQFKKWKGAS